MCPPISTALKVSKNGQATSTMRYDRTENRRQHVVCDRAAKKEEFQFTFPRDFTQKSCSKEMPNHFLQIELHCLKNLAYKKLPTHDHHRDRIVYKEEKITKMMRSLIPDLFTKRIFSSKPQGPLQQCNVGTSFEEKRSICYRAENDFLGGGQAAFLFTSPPLNLYYANKSGKKTILRERKLVFVQPVMLRRGVYNQTVMFIATSLYAFCPLML